MLSNCTPKVLPSRFIPEWLVRDMWVKWTFPLHSSSVSHSLAKKLKRMNIFLIADKNTSKACEGYFKELGVTLRNLKIYKIK
jgi:hypothetical protein